MTRVAESAYRVPECLCYWLPIQTSAQAFQGLALKFCGDDAGQRSYVGPKPRYDAMNVFVRLVVNRGDATVTSNAVGNRHHQRRPKGHVARQLSYDQGA